MADPTPDLYMQHEVQRTADDLVQTLSAASGTDLTPHVGLVASRPLATVGWWENAAYYWKKEGKAQFERRHEVEKNAFVRLTALRLALRDLLDVQDEPCRLDHNGACQAHYVSRPCIVAAARDVLEMDGGSLL